MRSSMWTSWPSKLDSIDIEEKEMRGDLSEHSSFVVGRPASNVGR